jgi:hypothetical protein
MRQLLMQERIENSSLLSFKILITFSSTVLLIIDPIHEMAF